jgi:NADPH:quinone reductase-like Zn-dependent oxidoreductase
MKSLCLREFGNPTTSAELIDTEPPQPGRGQLLVSLEASPINPSDLLLIRGFYGHRPVLPAALGTEGVGQIVAAGEGVDPGRIGGRVLIIPTLKHATWQDQVVVDEADAFAVDADTDVLQVAMLGVNPMTADVLLRRFVDLRPGDWVGQTGGNSAVGRAVITLAKLAGYRTLNVVRRPEVAQELMDLGADAVVVSGPDVRAQLKKALGGDRISLLLDATAGDVVAELAPWLVHGGTLVSYGGMSGAPLVVRPGDLIFRDLQIRGFWQKNWLDTAPREQALSSYSRLAALVSDGSLHAPIAATYPLEKYEDALTHAGRPDRVGKVLFAW